MIGILFAAALGATNPAVTQADIAQTICVKGWTATIRPTRREAWSLKRNLLQGRKAKGLILDHVVPLEVGGAPRDLANLQLQTRAAATRKDRIENRIHREVCAGTMTLQSGQATFLGDHSWP